jgi:peptidoglycan lytic transglycosylase
MRFANVSQYVHHQSGMPCTTPVPNNLVDMKFHTEPMCLISRAVAIAFAFAGALGVCAQDAFSAPPLPDRSPKRSESSPAAGQTPTVVKIAKPAKKSALQPEEEGYRQTVAAMAGPLLPPTPDAAAREATIKALELVDKGQISEAQTLKAKLADPVAQTLVDWRMLRVGYGTTNDYLGFLTTHADWPDQTLLRKRLEQALFKTGGSAKELLDILQKWPPLTGTGIAVQAAAHLALGDKDKAKALARQAWCRADLPYSYEDDFLRRLGALVGTADHKCRLNKLLVVQMRGKDARRAQARRIRPLLKKLDAADRKKFTARLSIFLHQRAAPQFLRKVPRTSRKHDAGFAFQYARYLRRRQKYAAAWKVLANVPANDERIVNHYSWWVERRSQALNAIRAGKYQLAYRFVARADPKRVNPAKDQAFFAGWIALKFLNNPRKALEHFEKMRALADGPLSRSKSEFWVAETYKRLGDEAKSRQHLEAAARVRDTFHGLLARERLAVKPRQLTLPLPDVPTSGDVETLQASSVLKAAVLTHRLGLDRGNYALRFFGKVGGQLKSAGQFVLLAQIARTLGDGQLEVRIGKMGIARGYNLYIYAYPIDLLPDYDPLREPVERAMLLAIARQESEFDTSIVSRAGARGILQVMPVTARHICRQYKIKCKIKELLHDPGYNARIGSAYIADRMDDFKGSYILTLTGYNAGPGRTREWLRKIGDPRSRKVNPLDWIYRIPFDETRSYVQKVLSNLQVYRARLGQDRPLRLASDIQRARQ